MTDDEKIFSKKVNSDIAKNKLKKAIFSMFLYLFLNGLMLNEFIYIPSIIGIVMILLLLIVKLSIEKNKIFLAKMLLITTMILVVISMVCDIALDIIYFREILPSFHRHHEQNILGLMVSLVWVQAILQIVLRLLFVIYKKASKAYDPIGYKETTDWFYERKDQ